MATITKTFGKAAGTIAPDYDDLADVAAFANAGPVTPGDSLVIACLPGRHTMVADCTFSSGAEDWASITIMPWRDFWGLDETKINPQYTFPVIFAATSPFFFTVTGDVPVTYYGLRFENLALTKWTWGTDGAAGLIDRCSFYAGNDYAPSWSPNFPVYITAEKTSGILTIQRTAVACDMRTGQNGVPFQNLSTNPAKMLVNQCILRNGNTVAAATGGYGVSYGTVKNSIVHGFGTACFVNSSVTTDCISSDGSSSSTSKTASEIWGTLPWPLLDIDAASDAYRFCAGKVTGLDLDMGNKAFAATPSCGAVEFDATAEEKTFAELLEGCADGEWTVFTTNTWSQAVQAVIADIDTTGWPADADNFVQTALGSFNSAIAPVYDSAGDLLIPMYQGGHTVNAATTQWGVKTRKFVTLNNTIPQPTWTGTEFDYDGEPGCPHTYNGVAAFYANVGAGVFQNIWWMSGSAEYTGSTNLAPKPLVFDPDTLGYLSLSPPVVSAPNAAGCTVKAGPSLGYFVAPGNGVGNNSSIWLMDFTQVPGSWTGSAVTLAGIAGTPFNQSLVSGIWCPSGIDGDADAKLLFTNSVGSAWLAVQADLSGQAVVTFTGDALPGTTGSLLRDESGQVYFYCAQGGVFELDLTAMTITDVSADWNDAASGAAYLYTGAGTWFVISAMHSEDGYVGALVLGQDPTVEGVNLPMLVRRMNGPAESTGGSGSGLGIGLLSSMIKSPVTLGV